MRPSDAAPAPPPESWITARRVTRAVADPIERFMHISASSGIVLLVAAVLALVWANSPWGESYDHLWHTPITVGIGPWVFEETLHFWINDLLMTVFFLVVGLEIKREITEGALSSLRRAALPIAAAVGGMLVPAAIFLMLNSSGPGQRGWGVPMATDIAFAVGVLTLLGKRVPAALRVLLLAVAIIDDIGAILVIAIFYSSGFDVQGLLPVGGGLLAMIVLKGAGVRSPWIYVVPGLVLCGGFLQLGIHPTIAGVIAGLLTPAQSWFGKEGFIKTAREAVEEFQQKAEDPERDDRDLMAPLQKLALARREALSPARSIEHALHPYVAFGIMPIFALANAGVHLQGMSFAEPSSLMVMLGILLGLVVGKPLGIMVLSWLSVKLGLCVLPPGVTWRGLFVLGASAGIGFTMAIFIAELAFTGSELLGVAKLGVLVGTAAAGALALTVGSVVLPREQPKSITDISAGDLESTASYWTGEVPPPKAPTRDGFQVRM
jgi:NhaA family Na+:H+ antiporter